MLEGSLLQIIIKVVGFGLLMALVVAFGMMGYMYFNEWIGNIIEKKAFFDYKCIACGNSISFNKVNCDVCNASIPNKVRNKYKLRIFSLGIILMSLLLLLFNGINYIVSATFVAGLLVWIFQSTVDI